MCTNKRIFERQRRRSDDHDLLSHYLQSPPPQSFDVFCSPSLSKIKFYPFILSRHTHNTQYQDNHSEETETASEPGSVRTLSRRAPDSLDPFSVEPKSSRLPILPTVLCHCSRVCTPPEPSTLEPQSWIGIARLVTFSLSLCLFLFLSRRDDEATCRIRDSLFVPATMTAVTTSSSSMVATTSPHDRDCLRLLL